MRLRKLVPYDSIVAFISKDDYLVPEFVSGDNFLLSLLSCHSHWNRGYADGSRRTANPSSMATLRWKPVLPTTQERTMELRSALAVPLDGVKGVVGVLALYQADGRCIYQRPSARAPGHYVQGWAFLENALKYRQAERLGHQ